MRKKLTIKALAIVLSVLWIFIVYIFYRTQKPFTVETFLAFADSFLKIALALFILSSGHRMGSNPEYLRFALSEGDQRIWRS